jgi:hypothetical protein
MTIILTRSYATFAQGATVDLDNSTEAALVAQGRATYTVNPGPNFEPLTATEQQELADGTSSVAALAATGSIVTSTGAVFGLSEVSPVVAVTATSTAFTGANLYRGIRVRALVGGPQTATLYDATSATGTPIDVVVFNATGTFFWDRPSDLLPGVGGRRPGTTGVHIVFSGGTSRTVDVMVEAA